MVNRLSTGRRTQIISALVEGNSIRSTERMTETHRDTVMRLAVEVGKGCEKIMDEKMRGPTVQADYRSMRFGPMSASTSVS